MLSYLLHIMTMTLLPLCLNWRLYVSNSLSIEIACMCVVHMLNLLSMVKSDIPMLNLMSCMLGIYMSLDIWVKTGWLEIFFKKTLLIVSCTRIYNHYVQCSPLNSNSLGPAKFVLITRCFNYEFAFNIKCKYSGLSRDHNHQSELTGFLNYELTGFLN